MSMKYDVRYLRLFTLVVVLVVRKSPKRTCPFAYVVCSTRPIVGNVGTLTIRVGPRT